MPAHPSKASPLSPGGPRSNSHSQPDVHDSKHPPPDDTVAPGKRQYSPGRSFARHWIRSSQPGQLPVREETASSSRPDWSAWLVFYTEASHTPLIGNKTPQCVGMTTGVLKSIYKGESRFWSGFPCATSACRTPGELRLPVLDTPRGPRHSLQPISYPATWVTKAAPSAAI